MRDEPRIEAVEVAAYRVPTDKPEADGTLHWEATELLVVEIRAGGKVGLGYSYTAAVPAAFLVLDKLQSCLVGENAFDLPKLWHDMNRMLRNIGRPGLGMMAIAALDQALWDLKAKLLDVCLTELWGRARASIRLYGSGGFTTYSHGELQAQLRDWLDRGIGAVKIKLGTGLAEDRRRTDAARDATGKDTALMVDANGAYSPREALELIDYLHERGVRWLEEPVSSDDLEGLRWLRNRAPSGLAIAAGEYGWDLLYYKQMLAGGAVDVLQADATRCGYTGFWQAAQLCEAWQLPLSAHCAPAVHAPVCAAVPRFLHQEYFHDHVRIESLFFDGLPVLRDGQLWPDSDRPGHGLSLRRESAQNYAI